MNVLHIKIVHPGFELFKQILEHRRFWRTWINTVANVNINPLSRLGIDDKIGHVIRRNSEAQRWGEQGKNCPMPFILSQAAKHRQDTFTGRAERTINMRAVVKSGDMGIILVQVQKLGVFARQVIANAQMQSVGVIAVVKILVHDLPVPRQVFVGLTDDGMAVTQSKVFKQGSQLVKAWQERRRIRIESSKNKAIPHLDR